MGYITHLHVAIAGFIAATAIAAGGLAWYGVRDGLWWAWITGVIVPVVGLAMALPLHYMGQLQLRLGEPPRADLPWDDHLRCGCRGGAIRAQPSGARRSANRALVTGLGRRVLQEPKENAQSCLGELTRTWRQIVEYPVDPGHARRLGVWGVGIIDNQHEALRLVRDTSPGEWEQFEERR